MRRVLLPIATALTGALVGPLAITFPFWIFVPFVGLMAVFVGFPLAAFGGLLFGVPFSIMSSAKLRVFSEQGRAKRLSRVVLFGAACGVLCYPLLLVVLDNSSSGIQWFGPLDSAVVLLSFLAYGGALSSLVMWPLVNLILAPNPKLKRGGILPPSGQPPANR